jgi:hypothetical protein
MSVTVYSEGHPHIPGGSADSLEGAILAFVHNADMQGVGVRDRFNMRLGESIETYLQKNSGMTAFKILRNSGDYGPLCKKASGSYTYRSKSMGIVTVGFDNVVKGMGKKIN